MKYCKYCGAELDDNAVVCAKCGKAVGSQPVQTVIVQQVEVEEPRKNGMGIAGFVLGLLSLVFCWLSIFFGWYIVAISVIAFVLSLAGIIVGKIKKQGIGLGIAGLVLSTVALIIIIVVVSILYAVI